MQVTSTGKSYSGAMKAVNKKIERALLAPGYFWTFQLALLSGKRLHATSVDQDSYHQSREKLERAELMSTGVEEGTDETISW